MYVLCERVCTGTGERETKRERCRYKLMPEEGIVYLPLLLSTLFLETGFLNKPESNQFG